ncbi:hypothetical protein HYH02_002609 [Chlamydomonas schloesseri]|uniref:NB-ARC domain-containing protein n=1 Tax=Chlamydomonas schloesseri TaxID=2026947 RepID=A0A835WV59_9CHLO|nr:hypothetical protein HYH02_002609 [Chlamydomonas schloesseri]|eukprot:KAG2453286.1 hypothetical protein HYH02_002609 [Chlamydomonas schloesseri]
MKKFLRLCAENAAGCTVYVTETYAELLPFPGSIALGLLGEMIKVVNVAVANRTQLRNLYSRCETFLDIMLTYRDDLQDARCTKMLDKFVNYMQGVVAYTNAYKSRSALVRLLTGYSDKREYEEKCDDLKTLTEEVMLALALSANASLEFLRESWSNKIQPSSPAVPDVQYTVAATGGPEALIADPAKMRTVLGTLGAAVDTPAATGTSAVGLPVALPVEEVSSILAAYMDDKGPHRHIKQVDLRVLWRQQFGGSTVEVPWFTFWETFPSALRSNPLREDDVNKLEGRLGASLAADQQLTQEQRAARRAFEAAVERSNGEYVSVFELGSAFADDDLLPQVDAVIAAASTTAAADAAGGVSGGSLRSGLPPDPGHLCGRDDETDDVITKLKTQSVALIAPGGYGKSTLAGKVAHQLLKESTTPLKVAWVSLRKAQQVSEVVSRLLDALDVKQRNQLQVQDAGGYVDQDSAAKQIVDGLKQLLDKSPTANSSGSQQKQPVANGGASSTAEQSVNGNDASSEGPASSSSGGPGGPAADQPPTPAAGATNAQQQTASRHMQLPYELLLVLDDMEDALVDSGTTSFVQAVLKEALGGGSLLASRMRLLITSRMAVAAPLGMQSSRLEDKRLSGLPEAHACALLQQVMGLGADAPTTEKTQELRQLARACHCVPLVLLLVGDAVANGRLTVQDVVIKKKDSTSPIDVILKSLPQQHQLAMLQLSVFPTGFSADSATAVLGLQQERQFNNKTRGLLAELERYNMIHHMVQLDTGRLGLHAAVRDVVVQLGNTLGRQLLGNSLKELQAQIGVSSVLGQQSYDTIVSQLGSQLLSQAELRYIALVLGVLRECRDLHRQQDSKAAVWRLQEWQADVWAVARLLENLEPDQWPADMEVPDVMSVADFISEQGYWVESKLLFEAAFKKLHQAERKEKMARVRALIDYGYCLMSQGCYKDAESKCKEAKVLAAEVRDNSLQSKARNSLALTWKAQERFDEAQTELEAAIKLVPEDQVETEAMGIMLNRANCLRELGRFKDARALYEKVVAVRERQLAMDPASKAKQDKLATAYNNFGNCHLAEGRYEEAAALYEKARKLWDHLRLDKRGMAFTTAEDADVAYALVNLGHAAFWQGDYRRALGHYEESLKVRESWYGRDHLDVAESLEGKGICIAMLASQQQRQQEKGSGAAGKRRDGQQLGEQQPAALTDSRTLPAAAGDPKYKYEDAEGLLKRALNMRQSLQRQCPGHKAIALTRRWIAACHAEQRRYHLAQEELERALEELEQLAHVQPQQQAQRAFSDEQSSESIQRQQQFPETASISLALADVHRHQYSYNEAADRYTRVLEWHKAGVAQRTTQHHPEAAKALCGLALCRIQQHKFDDAEQHLLAAQKVVHQLLEQHPDKQAVHKAFYELAKARADAAASAIRR